MMNAAFIISLCAKKNFLAYVQLKNSFFFGGGQNCGWMEAQSRVTDSCTDSEPDRMFLMQTD